MALHARSESAPVGDSCNDPALFAALLTEVAHHERRTRANRVEADLGARELLSNPPDGISQVCSASEDVEAWRGERVTAAAAVQDNRPHLSGEDGIHRVPSALDAAAQARQDEHNRRRRW